MAPERTTVQPWTYLKIQKAIATFADAFFGTESNENAIVWHYTNAAGLIGILESGYLRGTNYAFMNDASEFDYGCAVGHEVLEKLQQEELERPEFFARIAAALKQFTEESEIYLSCFSEFGDDLSQWRGYSSGPDRFSLGIRSAELREREPTALMQAVEYDRDAQRSHVRRFLLEAWMTVSAQGSADSEGAAATMLVPYLFDLLCFYKNAEFAAEREWRIAKRLSTAELTDVGFNDSPTGLRAFVPLCALSGRAPLPLVEVNILSAHPVRAEKFVKMLLRKCNYLNVKVTRSKVPFVL